MYEKEIALGVYDIHRYNENQILLREAIKRIRERPYYDALITLTSMPRLWISLGAENTSVIHKVTLLFSFGLLFVFMVIGGFLARKSQSPTLVGAIIICSYYTLVFAHLNTEGRYVIPARFFSFLLISVAIAYFLRLYFPRLLSDEIATAQ